MDLFDVENWRKKYAAFWYDGFEERWPENVPYRSFGALPFGRKLFYAGLFGGAILPLRVLAKGAGLLGIKIAPELDEGMPFPPIETPLATHGPSKEDKEAAGLDSEYFLTKAQQEEFKNNGVIGPFTAVPPAVIAKLVEQIKEFKATGKPDWPGMHLQVPELGAVFQEPTVARRVASLLGEDLKIWRTDFFVIPPKSGGTYWHSEAVFREWSGKPTLIPPPDRKDNMAQVTVWLALTPAKKVNGCLKFLPGSQIITSAVDFRDKVMHGRWRWHVYVAQQDFSYIHFYLQSGIGQLQPFKSAFPLMRMLMKPFLEKYAAIYERWTPKSFECEPGQFIVFTSNTLHGSWPNLTDDTRWALGARITTRNTKVVEKQYEESRVDVHVETLPVAARRGPNGARTRELEGAAE